MSWWSAALVGAVLGALATGAAAWWLLPQPAPVVVDVPAPPPLPPPGPSPEDLRAAAEAARAEERARSEAALSAIRSRYRAERARVAREAPITTEQLQSARRRVEALRARLGAL